MKKITIINGPNLNLLGKREPDVYGSESFEAFLEKLRAVHPDVEFTSGFNADGIVLNPGGYTHTSVAIGDAIAAIKTPVIEVHISNVHAREDFRKISHVSAKAMGTITGLGLNGYAPAVRHLKGG